MTRALRAASRGVGAALKVSSIIAIGERGAVVMRDAIGERVNQSSGLRMR
jgi:hypothetical protein